MVATSRAVFIVNMINNQTPEWIPNDSQDGIQVAFINDDGKRDGWQSVLQPVPFTNTSEIVVFTSAVNMDLLIANQTNWQFKEYCAVEVQP